MVTVTIDSFFGYDAEATTLIFDDTTELVAEDVIESPTGERIFVSEIPSSVEITAIRGWDSTTADILNDNDALTVVEESVVAIDYTNLLEVAIDVDADFTLIGRDGALQTLQPSNTQGKWCLETSGASPSPGTGPTANPTGRSAFIYAETSNPAASLLWTISRITTFDNTAEAILLDLMYNLNVTIAAQFKIQYATVASPNDTSDWTTLETVVGTATDEWISRTFDFSSAPSTTTLRIRIRYESPNSTHLDDIAFSTWREYTPSGGGGGDDAALLAQANSDAYYYDLV